jgi:hypothetical protein
MPSITTFPLIPHPHTFLRLVFHSIIPNPHAPHLTRTHHHTLAPAHDRFSPACTSKCPGRCRSPTWPRYSVAGVYQMHCWLYPRYYPAAISVTAHGTLVHIRRQELKSAHLGLQYGADDDESIGRDRGRAPRVRVCGARMLGEGGCTRGYIAWHCACMGICTTILQYEASTVSASCTAPGERPAALHRSECLL